MGTHNKLFMLWFPGQPDRRWGRRTAPRVPPHPSRPPSHTVVKQTTSEEDRPIFTLLLLYSHRQDVSSFMTHQMSSMTRLGYTHTGSIVLFFPYHIVASDSTKSEDCVIFFNGEYIINIGPIYLLLDNFLLFNFIG